ncbi:MAG: hypothetical protein ACI8VC_002529 [Candidatus Endobugula sp.]|jgi:hypothetical protein
MADSIHHKDIIDQSLLNLLPTFKVLVEDLSRDTLRSLEHAIEHTATNKQHALALESFNLYKKNKHLINDIFCKQLCAGFKKFKTNELDTQVSENEFQKEAWSLVDDDVLEESISIRSFSSEANQRHKEKIWQLEQRLTFINKGLPINESSSPLSPLQFFSALRFGLKKLPLDISGKIACYKILSELLTKKYANILNIINTQFIEDDVLPGLNYATQHSPLASKSEDPRRITDSHPDKNDADKVYPLDRENSPSKVTADNDANDERRGTGIEETEIVHRKSGSSQIPLVNTIRNLLQRARNISGDDVSIPILTNAVDNASRTQTTPYTVESEEDGVPTSLRNNNFGVSNNAYQPPIGDRTLTQAAILFDTSRIIDAVESVRESSATSHFFENNTQTSIITTPTNIAENSAKVYQQLAKAAPNGSINAKNMYTIDMVGMLFDYILADENLPDSIKTLLSHLHTPFLKLAFIDERFFEYKEHKSRMLLDSLADAGTNFVGHDGTSQYNIYNEIKKVVQRVIKEFKNDVNLFAELLMEFTLLKKRIIHIHNLRERNSIEKKRGQEKHAQAKILARQEIKARIEGRRVPASIINLLSPWFVYLTFLQLKEEKNSIKWAEALAIIDNLMTYCTIKKVKDNVEKLEKGFDEIIKKVDVGLTSIAYNPVKIASVLAELKQLKDDVINKQAIKTTITKQDTNKDTSNTESAQDEVSDTPTPEEERVMNYIKLIEPGTWIEYDKTARMKVSGFSAESRKYILINQSNQEVTMRSRLELARDLLSEKAAILDGTAKPLFERALERIRHNLDKQVLLSNSPV